MRSFLIQHFVYSVFCWFILLDLDKWIIGFHFQFQNHQFPINLALSRWGYNRKTNLHQHYQYTKDLSKIQSIFENSRSSKFWSTSDLNDLIEFKNTQDKKWEDISLLLNRTEASCRLKYQSLIQQERSVLVRSQILSNLLPLVIEYGENWHLISKKINLLQENCKYYYVEFLNSFAVKSWSQEEDDLLRCVFFENTWISPTMESVNLNELFVSSPSTAFQLYSNMSISWRNISHYLQRDSYTCRKRFLEISFPGDFIGGLDIWLPGEISRFQELSKKLENNTLDSKGRELGRLRYQCYNLDNFKSMSSVDGSGSPIPQRLRNIAWNLIHDNELLNLVEINGKKWKMIGTALNRTCIQCFQRYQILKFKNNNQSQLGWTVDQNRQLFTLVEEYGPRWTKIGSILNRSSYVCRAAYKRLLDKIPEASMPKLNKPSRQQKKLDNILQTLSIDQLQYSNLNNLSTIFSLDQLQLMNSSNTRRKWDKEEDECLKKFVNLIGRKWSIIAEIMNRSPEDVMLRYDFKVSIPKLGSWTKDEDTRLASLVAELGFKWSQIGEILGRSGPQCCTRYRQSLDPRLKFRLWTSDDDEQLISLRDNSGYNWAMISAVLDRAAPSCRYRYLKIKKMK